MSFNLDKDHLFDPKKGIDTFSVDHVFYTPTLKRFFYDKPVCKISGHYLKRFIILYYRWYGKGRLPKVQYKFYITFQEDLDQALLDFEKAMNLKHWTYHVISANSVSSWIQEDEDMTPRDDVLNGVPEVK